MENEPCKKKLVLGHTFRLSDQFGWQMIMHMYKLLFVERARRIHSFIKLPRPNIITLLTGQSDQDMLELVIPIISFHRQG
jgi:hypothetical protein